MWAVRLICAVVMLIVGAVGLSADDKSNRQSDRIDDELISKEPLTIVFRQLAGFPPPGKPSKWEWSINSAGDAELTIDIFPNVVRQKINLPAEKLATFRQVLRDEKFL
jgi:hypothetical protein